MLTWLTSMLIRRDVQQWLKVRYGYRVSQVPSNCSIDNALKALPNTLIMFQPLTLAMGELDIVISNAGWTKFADFFDNVDEAVWDRCFSANVKSHLFLLHAAREQLQKTKGAFIMTSSVAGVKPSGSSIVGCAPQPCSECF